MRAPKLSLSSLAVGVAGLGLSAGIFLWSTAPRGGCHSQMKMRGHHPQMNHHPRIQAHPPVDGKTPCPAMMRAHHGELTADGE